MDFFLLNVSYTRHHRVDETCILSLVALLHITHTLFETHSGNFSTAAMAHTQLTRINTHDASASTAWINYCFYGLPPPPFFFFTWGLYGVRYYKHKLVAQWWSASVLWMFWGARVQTQTHAGSVHSMGLLPLPCPAILQLSILVACPSTSVLF